MPFIPLQTSDKRQEVKRGFTPIDEEQDQPENPAVRTVRAISQVYPVAETAANLASQAVALPAAGLAGLGTLATNAMGLTDTDPVNVVHAVGGALTYQPQTELGQYLTQTAMMPFEKLAEAGQYAGGKTLDVIGSPVAATAVDVAVNSLPMAIVPAAKLAKGRKAPVQEVTSTPAEVRQGFTPLEQEARSAPDSTRVTPEAVRAEETAAAAQIQSRTAGGSDARQAETRRLETDSPALHESESSGFSPLRREGDQSLPGVAGELRAVHEGHGAATDASALAGATGRAGGLHAGELRVDNAGRAAETSHILPEGNDLRPNTDSSGSGAAAWTAEQGDGVAQAGERFAAGEPAMRVPKQNLEMADAPGRDPAAAGMGAPGRAEALGAMGQDQARMAGREGADASAIPPQRTGHYALVEASNLKSRDFREAPDRHQQERVVQQINHEFDPAHLTDALDDATGAPIVLRDGTVEAGHKRAEVIKRIYQANGLKAESYRQHLRENADSFGLAPEQIDGMKKPVLVRLPDEPAPRHSASAELPREDVQGMAGEVQNSWAPGQNYIPLRDSIPSATRETVAAAKATKPIRREEVLRPFLDALGINVYHGKVKGKRLGYYMPQKETLRVKNKSDLEVTAHEIGHLLDDRIPAIRAAWRNDKELREQLKAVSYDKESVSEGYAESIRLFLTNPEALEAAAPKVYGWLETFADTHETGPALRKAQSGMTSWYEQSALDRARSKIGDPAKLKNRPLLDFVGDKWKGFRKGFRQTLVDDLDGVRLAELGLTDKLSPMGAYETARLSRAAASITDGALRFGHPVKKADGSFTYSGKGLEEILQPVAGRLDDFMTYAVGRSSQELMMQGREHLYSKAEIQAMTALETPEFRKAFAEYGTWNRGVLDFAESMGTLNPETRKLWNRQEYLPFWRVDQGVSGRGAVSGQWSGVKGLKGGTGNLREPLQNMVGNANMLISAALKNDARAKVVELVEKEQGGGKFMQRIPAESKQVKVDAKQVADAVLKGMGIESRANLSPEAAQFVKHIDAKIAEAPEFYSFYIGGQAPKGSNIVAVMKAGKPEYFEVADPLLLRALTAIDRPAQSWIIKLLGLPKRIGQASIVLDPTFMATNFARDQVMAGVMTRSGYRPLLDALDGMQRRMTTDSLYRDWVANGGGMSSIFLDESKFKAKLERFYQNQGINYKTVIDSRKKFFSMIETFGDAFESATRIGEFKRALAQGDNPRHAAYKSKEVSVDFSMSGDAPAVRALFDVVMFLRPTVVSWDRLYRGVTSDPNRGMIAAKTAMVGLASAALYLMNRGDPRYDDLPEYLKDSHWHVYLGEKHFMLPKAFEVGAIGSIAERSVGRILDENPEGLAEDFWRIIATTFHLNLMPQFAAPFVEQYANKNSFTGAPIETPGQEGLQPFLRSKPGTSETMKAAGLATRDLPESAQLNPARAEALLRGFLNSWASYGLLASDRFVVGKNMPEMRADEMPVARRFYQSEPPKHTRFETEFYQYLSEAKRLHGTMKELDDLGLQSFADEKEKNPLSSEAKPLERAAKNLSAINKDAEQVRRDQTMTPAEKRTRLDELTIERNALFKAAVQDSKQAVKTNHKE